MGEWRTFSIALWKSENYFCPPVEKSFELTIPPSRIRRAEFFADLNPYMPGWPLYYGCVEGDCIYVNGHPVKYSGDGCNQIRAEIPVEYLRQGVNTIHFDIRASPTCVVQPQGNITGYLTVEAYVEEGEEPVKPPEKVPRECKIFGLVKVGKMSPEMCNMLNLVTLGGIGLIGLALVISLVKS